MAVERFEVNHMSSCIGGAFDGSFQPSGPLINDCKKGRIRFFDTPALAEDAMRFQEGWRRWTRRSG